MKNSPSVSAPTAPLAAEWCTSTTTQRSSPWRTLRCTWSVKSGRRGTRLTVPDDSGGPDAQYVDFRGRCKIMEINIYKTI